MCMPKIKVGKVYVDFESDRQFCLSKHRDVIKMHRIGSVLARLNTKSMRLLLELFILESCYHC